MEGYSDGETDALKTEHKELWDVDAKDVTEIHDHIKQNVVAGIPIP